MPGDLHPRKRAEDQGGPGADRPLPAPGPVNIVSVRNRFAGRPAGSGRRPSLSYDYLKFKAMLAEAVDDIKVEIRGQHQHTRAEVQIARHEILDAVKSSPSEFVKLISEFGALFLLFCLAVRFTLGFELVNTAFAGFMLFALALYWLMALVKQKKKGRGDR